MSKLVKKFGVLAIAGLLVAGLTGCGKEDSPTAPIVKTKFNYEVTSRAINPASAYLQSVDLIIYTAAGAGAVNEMPTDNPLPWSAEAEVTLGSGAGLSISYTFTMLDPTAATRIANTEFTLTIKKDGNVVKTETGTMTADGPEISIDWAQE